MNPITQRPKSLCEVAERSKSLESWGLELSDFLDEINFRQKRGLPLVSCFEAAPLFLRGRINQGEVADAFAAALAEYLFGTVIHQEAPAWTKQRDRFLTEPWFADDSPRIREYLSSSAPVSFREHGVFIDAPSLTRV